MIQNKASLVVVVGQWISVPSYWEDDVIIVVWCKTNCCFRLTYDLSVILLSLQPTFNTVVESAWFFSHVSLCEAILLHLAYIIISCSRTCAG